jgi:hypothetical protein
MKKAIIIASGTPEGKNKFDEIVKKSSWSWNVNFKNYLGSLSKNFYWSGERDETYYKFIVELSDLTNRYFSSEEKYLREKIEKFNSDDSEQKIGEDGKVFTKFILIIHGVSRDLVDMLESDYGLFQLHISRRDLNTNTESHDYVLYEDDENFEEEVERVLNVLTK